MSHSATLAPVDAQDLLRKYGLKPVKGLGQNFLEDSAALEKIVQAAEIGGEDAILEIGPGLGSLTRHLARAARRVVAVEIDARLIPALEDQLAGYGNVEIIQGDILKLQPGRLMQEPAYKVVANIPYNITSALIRHLLAPKTAPSSTDAFVRPDRVVLTIQKEVAERICAQPGELSMLALSVQVFGKPAIAATIAAEAFFPSPKVDSACLRIDIYPRPIVADELLDWFFRVAKAGFSQKRKTLRNALAGGLRLSAAQAESLLRECGIDPQRRAETVTIQEWGSLAAKMKEGAGQ
jgi:16S rRNA (adenine1518-N6/adenine1519-N6)-dimethyltransferase